LAADDSVQAGLKEVMRVFPQGVTVVTMKAVDGPKGLTVSAFTSVSLDPPLVLVSISKTSGYDSLFANSAGFAVNFLADDQKTISDRFAGRHPLNDRFEGVGFAPGLTGSPVIQGVRAVIECRTWKVYEGGDHSLVVGEVIRAERLSDKAPLVYFVQQYTTTERPETVAPPPENMW